MSAGRPVRSGIRAGSAAVAQSQRSTKKRPPDATEPRVQAGDFKARCLELMDRVAEAGVEYTITKRGRPVAKLVPCEDLPEESFGFLAGTVVEQGDIVSPDPEAWEPSAAARRPQAARTDEVPHRSTRTRSREPRADRG